MLFDITLDYPKFRKSVGICMLLDDVENCSLVLDKDGQPGNYLWIRGRRNTHTVVTTLLP